MAEARRLVAGGALALALLAAGCGGGGGKSTGTQATATTTQAGTPSAFATKVDAACKPLADRIANLKFPYPDFDAQAPDSATLPKVGRFIRRTNAALGYDALLERLQGYTAPADQAQDYAKMLTTLRALVAFNEAQATAAIAGDKKAFTASVENAQGVTDAAHGAARVLGAPNCAQL